MVILYYLAILTAYKRFFRATGINLNYMDNNEIIKVLIDLIRAVQKLEKELSGIRKALERRK